MPKPSTIFNTVRTEGAILPAELLQRIVGGDATLEGLKPTDYHLSPGERLGEAATRSWNRLIGVWQTYRDIVENLSEEATGTTETRERWLLPLFQELGYGRLQTQRSVEIEGKTYSISHKASEPVAIHLVSFKWDLDKRPTSALTTYHSPLTKILTPFPHAGISQPQSSPPLGFALQWQPPAHPAQQCLPYQGSLGGVRSSSDDGWSCLQRFLLAVSALPSIPGGSENR